MTIVIAQIAKYAGNDSIYNEFMARSRNYVNQFNRPPASCSLPQRRSFVAPFASTYTGIWESNARHYLRSVQHDVDSPSRPGGKEI